MPQIAAFHTTEDIEKAPRIKDTLQVHIVKRLFNIQKVSELELLNVSTDKKPFLLNAMANIQPVDINITQSMIVTVVFVGSVISQLENGFNARFVWFGFKMIASIYDYQSNFVQIASSYYMCSFDLHLYFYFNLFHFPNFRIN